MNTLLAALYLETQRAERFRRARERRIGEDGNIRVRHSRSTRRWP
jgi:hypothetical protein